MYLQATVRAFVHTDYKDDVSRFIQELTWNGM